MTIIIKSNQVATKTLGNVFGLPISDYSLLLDFNLGEYRVKDGGGFQKKTLSDVIDFRRATKATYIDDTGSLQEAAADTPRIHLDATTGYKGLLIESTHTQLLSNIYSPATQTIPIVHDADRRLVLSVRGSGSAKITGVVELQASSPALATENNPSLYASTASGNITIAVTGSLSAISLHWASTIESVSPKMFTPAGITTVAMDIAELKPSILAAALGGSSEFTVVMRATEKVRPNKAGFTSRGSFFGVGDTSELRKGIYTFRSSGAAAAVSYSFATDAVVVDSGSDPFSESIRNHTVAVSYKANDSKIYFAGLEIRRATEPFSLNADILQLGSNLRRTKNGDLNGIIRTLAIYPYAMTEEQLYMLK